MATVKFNDIEEFCAEMEKDASDIERRIVRTTTMTRTSSLSPNIRHIIALATYSVDGQVIRLESYCGDLWGVNQDQDKQVIGNRR